MKRFLLAPIFLAVILFAFAGQAQAALPNLNTTPSYIALRDYVGKLEARTTPISADTKKRLAVRLSDFYLAATGEVTKRNTQRRTAAWKKNRADLAVEVKAEEKVTLADISEVRSRYAIVLVELKNDYKADAREMREEWQPKIAVLLKKKSDIRKSLRGRALRRQVKKVNLKIEATLERRENRVAEIYSRFKAEEKAVKVAQGREVNELNDQLSATTKELTATADQAWTDQQSTLRAARAAEQGLLDGLRNRGQTAIKKQI